MSCWGRTGSSSLGNEPRKGGCLWAFFLVGSRWSLLRCTKHILKRALQPVHHLLQPSQGDGLFTVFQAKQHGGRESCLLGELSKWNVPTLPLEKGCELPVQWRWGSHPSRMGKSLFLLRNVLTVRLFRIRYTPGKHPSK